MSFRRLAMAIATILAVPAAAEQTPWAGMAPAEAMEQYRDILADVARRGRPIYEYDQVQRLEH